MDAIWSAIVAALLSGVLATLLTILIQKHNESLREKKTIFEILMSHRYQIFDEVNVQALNRIDSVFVKKEDVRQAFKDFKRSADEYADSPDGGSKIFDKYIKLLEIMARAIGYKNVAWEEIKNNYYYPRGLSAKINEEQMLRRAIIEQAKAISSTKQDYSKNSLNQNKQNELGMQILFKLLDSPDGVERISKMIELSKKLNRKEKDND